MDIWYDIHHGMYIYVYVYLCRRHRYIQICPSIILFTCSNKVTQTNQEFFVGIFFKPYLTLSRRKYFYQEEECRELQLN